MIQQGTAHQACHSPAQHAMTWDCMTQHGMALHGMMQHGTAQHDVAQQGTAWRRPPHLGMALHSTAQHDLIKCVCNPNLHSADLITAASKLSTCYHESQGSNTFCSLCCRTLLPSTLSPGLLSLTTVEGDRPQTIKAHEQHTSMIAVVSSWHIAPFVLATSQAATVNICRGCCSSSCCQATLPC